MTKIESGRPLIMNPISTYEWNPVILNKHDKVET